MIDTITITDFIKENEHAIQQELIDFLTIPSISTDSSHAKDVRQAAEFVKTTLEKAGAEKAQVMETGGLPIVYGEKMINDSLPTILIYGHYDVQPADPIELWDTDPFTPVIKNGKIYARGACDDKAQMMIPIKAFEFLCKTHELKYNLKFLFEGEEEVGSVSLSSFIQSNATMLKADAALIVDTFLFNEDTPAIVYGVKGAVMLEMEITGPAKDMHSGLYGGIIKNPADEISRLLASLKDDNGKISINGFYDGIIQPSPSDQQHLNNWANLSGNLAELQIQAYEPTLEINGITSGYSGEGAKTIIPSKASAKVSIRLVPGQSPGQIVDLFKTHMSERLRSSDFKMIISQSVGCTATVMDTDHWMFSHAKKACQQTFRNEIVFQRMGGSIPVVGFLQNHLSIPSLLIGFGLESDNIHSPNEHYHLSNYYRGIETLTHFLKSSS